MKRIADCTFGLDGKTYEYLVDDQTILPYIDGEEYLPPFGHVTANCVGLTWKLDGIRDDHGNVPFVDPKDLRPVKIQRIKPLGEQVYVGELKRLTHILYL